MSWFLSDMEILMVRTYKPKKVRKVMPRVNGRTVEVERTARYVLLWVPAKRCGPAGARRTMKSARPKRWANLVLFLFDASKRKRSYRLAWDGGRYAATNELRLLVEREPALVDEVERVLVRASDRIVRMV